MNYLVCFSYTNILAGRRWDTHGAMSAAQWGHRTGSELWDVQGLPGGGEEAADKVGDPVSAGGEVAGRQVRTDDLVPPRLKRGASGGICFLAQCNGSCCTWEGSV